MQYELRIDKELEELCPSLSADELRLLEESIESEGCRDEIVIWANHDKTIIDGHNRYRICKRLKLPYKTKSLAFVSKDEVKLWMLRNQMGRRNLSDGQRAMLAAKVANLAHGERKSDTQICVSQSEAAEEFGVSTRTVSAAKRVLDKGTPELQAAVTNGEVSVSAAAELAKKPKAEQKKIVAKGAGAVKAAAKKSKADKKITAAVVGTCPDGECEFVDGACRRCHDPEPITNGPLDFPTDVLDKQLAADKAGELDLTKLQAKYDTMLNCITQITKIWNELCADERDGVYVAPKKQRVITALGELRPPIAQARPMKVCTFCKGKGCDKCQGCGWWPRSVVEGLSR